MASGLTIDLQAARVARIPEVWRAVRGSGPRQSKWNARAGGGCNRMQPWLNRLSNLVSPCAWSGALPDSAASDFRLQAEDSYDAVIGITITGMPPDAGCFGTRRRTSRKIRHHYPGVFSEERTPERMAGSAACLGECENGSRRVLPLNAAQ